MCPLPNKFNSVAIDIKHWLNTEIRLIIFLRPDIQTFRRFSIKQYIEINIYLLCTTQVLHVEIYSDIIRRRLYEAER